ncbi:hypothetical protein [Paenibacillus elgii]|uniref:hypothetical protein n=1 Tax=Paenibacillus elgii TaxID=189691 RepID=UPI000248DB08|nr:hypothetical protein [Paenibacillus elgii]
MSDENSPIKLGLATVSSNGLLFQGKIYSNSNMIKHKWFELAEKQGEWQIPIFYQPLDMSEILLFDLQSIEVATSIDTSNEISPEMKELYFEALNFLKTYVREQKPSNNQS